MGIIRLTSQRSMVRHRGPDEKQRKAGLRLDQPNRAVIAGDILASALNQRIAKPANDPQAMPPETSHKSLTAAQKLTLRRWIGEGARYEKHWAFIPPVRREPGGGIDGFIQARLAPRASV